MDTSGVMSRQQAAWSASAEGDTDADPKWGVLFQRQRDGTTRYVGDPEHRQGSGRPMEENVMKKRTVLVFLLAVVFVSAFVSESAAQQSLRNPGALTETAPATYSVRFATSAGDFVVEVSRDWAPHGADRFYNLVKNGFYNDARFFRVISNFMVQFGINGDPAVSAVWQNARIPVDPVKESNKRGYITYAMGASPDTRTTQVFINFRNNANLDDSGFAPFGKVVSGMDVVDKLHSGYGEGAPRGKGPAQGRLQAEGNTYLIEEFPRLDHITAATIVE
jgi:peptidyl-prolyl cis-trans isomerase A (cyclophilin A)